VQARYCPSCGAPAPVGSRFCSYCGSTIPDGPAGTTGAPSVSQPLPTLTPPPPPPAPYGGMAAPPPRRRSRLLIVVVIIVVIILVIGVAAVLLVPPTPPIQVAGINVWAPDNVCGLNANPIGFTGWNGSTSQVQVIELEMPNFNSTSCTIEHLTTNTSGFTLSQVQVPLTIGFGANGNNTMNITVTSPSTSFNGILNLVVS
jgi:zinc-ribbon domain